MSVEPLLRSIRDRRQAFASARNLYARRLAPDFNVFRFIAPDELKLSRILAWLLSPSESHEQGSLFLEGFLKELNIQWAIDDFSSASVEIEDRTTEGRRVDIVVRVAGAVLGIENKAFGAPDQPNQAKDYLAWMDRQAPDGRVCLVYIGGGEGTQPSEKSISECDRSSREEARQFIATSFAGLLSWLTRARETCEAQEVSALLNSFKRFIEVQFMAVSDETEREAIVQTACSSQEYLDSALSVIDAGPAIRMQLFARLVSQLNERNCKVIDFDFSIERKRRFSGLSIPLRDTHGYSFCLEFQAGYVRDNNLHWLVYGVDKGDLPFDNEVKAQLDQEFDQGAFGQTWLWRRRASLNERHFPVEGDWWHSVAPWRKILDQKLADTILEASEKFRNAILQAQQNHS